MRPKIARPLAGGLLSWAALSAPAAALERYADAFDIYFGGIRAGELALDIRVDGDAYEARSELVSAGVVGFFYDASYSAAATGALPLADTYRPQRFEAQSAFGGKRQDLTITFGLTAPADVTSDPPYKPKSYQIDPAEQHGAIDPLTAAVALLRPAPEDEICGKEVTVFDGRHRIDIRLDPPEQSAEGLRCDAMFTRVAGFRPKDMKKQRDFPFRVYFQPGEDGLARLRRIVVETSYGLAVAMRKE